MMSSLMDTKSSGKPLEKLSQPPLAKGGFLCHTTYMKNIHLEHPEDSILDGTLTVLDAFLNSFVLSVKYDGSPAIVWGTNPATGNFFVGTKSVFNKKKIRICETQEQITEWYGGTPLEIILGTCLCNLPWTDRIFQGDFIGFGGEMDYTPNTITYSFSQPVAEEIIIAPHTEYVTRTHLRDAVAYPLCKLNPFPATNPDGSYFVKWIFPKAFGNYESLKESITAAKTLASAVEFASPKEVAQYKKELNAHIREGREVDPSEWDNSNLISFWKMVKGIKEDALFLSYHTGGPYAYIESKRIDSEGYVMHTEHGSWKLVNREVFSHANFTNHV